MTFLEHLYDSVGRLAMFEELNVSASALPASAMGLSDSSVRDLLSATAELARRVATLQAVLAGVAASRSGRDRGHGGLVQGSGHRNAVEFIRDVTGATRGEAIRTVRVGEALVDGACGASVGDEEVDAGGHPDPEAPPALWHEPLGEALLSGAITTAQHDAIRRGLGDPPRIEGRDDADVALAWRAAATQLAAEAPSCTVEDLAARARAVRDLIDPVGADERHATRFQKRSYRSWVDQDGVRHGSLVYDDEMGAWLDGVFASALAPRRGGPRFVAEDERQAAEELANDPRSNEQLAYDLLVDLLRAGALATAKDVYGTKEAGVRLVVMRDAVTGDTARRDAFGRLVASACTEDGGLILPGPMLERALCVTGSIDLFTDTQGNPLDLGREIRLFNARQRLTLATRDGGCLWPGCDRPPEYCEGHHIDHWAEGGTTDCDRGVLLCRFHHLHLHNGGWRITRDGKGPFLLHPPASVGGEPIVLQSTSVLRWLWDPPPERAHWRTAA